MIKGDGSRMRTEIASKGKRVIGRGYLGSIPKGGCGRIGRNGTVGIEVGVTVRTFDGMHGLTDTIGR